VCSHGGKATEYQILNKFQEGLPPEKARKAFFIKEYFKTYQR